MKSKFLKEEEKLKHCQVKKKNEEKKERTTN